MPHLAFFVAMVLLIANAAAQDPYQLNPGDLLDISVWREENMQLQVVILPDGSISIPLAGHLDVAGKTSEEVESEIKAKLTRFFPDIVLTVSVAEVRGNQVYVIGEVENPGVFVANRRLDVIQALSLAGGLSAFADEDGIKVIRRVSGAQQVMTFDYGAVQSGKGLSHNIILHSGDVVIVPTSRLF